MRLSELPLFEYAVDTREISQRAFVRGQLRRRANGYPAARFDRSGIVRGRLRTVKQSDLEDLDRAVEHTYKRRQVIANGRAAWAYVYVRDDFDALEVVTNGRWRSDT